MSGWHVLCPPRQQQTIPTNTVGLPFSSSTGPPQNVALMVVVYHISFSATSGEPVSLAAQSPFIDAPMISPAAIQRGPSTWYRLAMLILPLSFFTATAHVSAQSSNAPSDTGIHWHGYASWGYGRTNGNSFDAGEHNGDYHNFNFAMAMSTLLTERVRVSAQVAVTSEHDANVFDVNYAQVEWRLRDALRLRLGRVRQPFGLYTEVFQVGTLRPFFSLPHSLYGPSGTVSQFFTGASISGGRSLGNQWELEYDAYTGHIDLPTVHPLQEFADSLLESFSSVVGARLNLRGPAGWLGGMSGYTGHSEGHSRDRDYILGAHLEYVDSPVLMRTEFAYHHAPDERGTSGYLEAGYQLDDHWQLVARLDAFQGTFADPVIAAIPDGGKYREQAVGVNYWVAPTFVLKSSVHFTTGRRFALPHEDASGTVPAGVLPKNRTLLGVIGAQVSF